ncbi:hypothetical protein L1887_29499 [Cichorium endivia]|nr:hypothetical protein L1887_29499 [Cichorium endivia]
MKDSLMEISFHIPNDNTHFVGDENRPSAQVFREKMMSMISIFNDISYCCCSYTGQGHQYTKTVNIDSWWCCWYQI